MVQSGFFREDPKHDRLQSGFFKILDWIALHRQTFFSVTGTIAVIAIIAIFTFVNFKNLNTRAADQLVSARNLYLSGDFDGAIRTYDGILTQFPHTPSATESWAGKGDVFFKQRKFAEAVDSYQKCLEKKSSEKSMPIVLASLAAAQENNNQIDAAIATYQKFFEQFPNHFYAPKMYESLARCYELSSNVEAAKQTYEKIITLYPNTSWVDFARIRYQILSPKPFESGQAAAPVSQK